MARQILILDSSASMRRIIRTMILANISDATVHEAETDTEAMERIEDDNFHLVFFSRESSNQDWLDFIKRTKTNPDKDLTQFLIFTSNQQKDYIETAKAAGVADHLFIPCSPNELTVLVTKLCNPFALRATKRFYMPHTTAVIEQGQSCRMQADVINFSEGGIFCETEYSQEFNWAAPAMITMNFSLEGETITAAGFYSATRRIMVTATNADFSPKRVRIAYRFLTVPDETRQALEKVYAFAEQLQEMTV